MLVCRAWRALLACPSPAWQDIHLPVPRHHLVSWSASSTHATHGAAWFATRAGSVHSYIDHRLYAPPNLVRALLAHNLHTIRTLDIVALQSAATWPLIAQCLQLQHLRLHVVGPWNIPQLQGLTRLTSMVHLELGGAELLSPRDVDVAHLHCLTSLILNVPVVHERAFGSLTALQSLSIPELYCGQGLPLGLPSTLTSLRIDAWRPTGALPHPDDVVALLTAPPQPVRAVATVLAALPRLVVLHLGGYAPDLVNLRGHAISAALSRLTALTSLALRRCGLEEVPTGLQALAVLRELDVRHNHLRGLPGWIASLPRLKCVRLERQRGFSLVLPLALAARRGLAVQVAPTVEPVLGGGSRLRLVVRLVSGCGETLCHLTMVGGRKGPGWRGLRLAEGRGGNRAVGGWRASLRPGDAGPHVGGGACECSGCTRRDFYAALQNVVVVHD